MINRTRRPRPERSAAPREAARACVYRGAQLAGTIDRTESGTTFRYDPAFLRTAPRGIAHNLPPDPRPVETAGLSLHTFFAGLMPEGNRLSELIRRTKSSPDDALTLLLAAGSDTVGDVSVVPEGGSPEEAAPTADVAAPELLSFPELFEKSVRYGTRGHSEFVVPGVQEKISAAILSRPARSRGRSKRFILKLDPPELPRLVENEHFFMELAARCGIRVPATRVVRDRDGNVALLVERFDRVVNARGDVPQRIHQEDVCQVLDRYPEDKYNIGYDDVARAFECCSAPIVERAKLLRLIAFAYITCNGDLHGKNVSLRTTSSGRVEMTEAYDLVSTLPYGDRSMALALEDREDNLKRKTFVTFGERFGVRAEATGSILDELTSVIPSCVADLGRIGLGARETRHLATTMKKRLRDLAA